MKKIKAKVLNKPKRLPSTLSITTEEIVQTINGLANPGNPIINWFEGYPDAKAAVHIKNGKYVQEESKEEIVFGGDISDTKVSDLKVVAYNGNEGGVYAEGGGSKVTVDGAVINLSGSGKGVGGPGTGVAIKNHAEMTLRNVVIDSSGKSRFCTVAEKYSTLRVYDSIISAHGVPYGEGIDSPHGLMATPPDALEIGGNSRAHCTMSNSYSYFYNSKIICDGWAALSTETAEGFVYLEANDCDIIVTKKGYGAYADPDCHDYFNRCNFDIDGMTAIIAGEGDMTYTDCKAKCASYFALMHCVMGVPEEVGTLIVNGGTISTKKETVRIKSQNVQIEFNNVNIKSDNNILVNSIWNDDPCATKASEAPYGVNVVLTDMDVAGDLIHEDPDRAMWVTLNSTTLNGAIANGNVAMDVGSKWIATADSTVIFITDVYPAQIDALAGVTIKAEGACAGTYDLASGGRLIIED